MLSNIFSATWAVEAACIGHDPELWALSDDLNYKKSDKEGFEKAEIICSKCPVITECWKHATDEDIQWTMRAGAWPTEWNPSLAGRPRARTCYRGHDTSDPASRKKDGSCIACVAYYRTRKACDEGHDLTIPGARGKGGACKECRKISQDKYVKKQRTGHCRNGHDLSLPGYLGANNKCLECRRQARKSRAKNPMQADGPSGSMDTTT